MALSGRTKAAFAALLSAMLEDVELVRDGGVVVGDEVERECIAVGKVVEVDGEMDSGGVQQVVVGEAVGDGERVGVTGAEQCIMFGDVVAVRRGSRDSGSSSAQSSGTWAEEVKDAVEGGVVHPVSPVVTEVAVPELRPMAVVHGPGPKLLRRVLKTVGVRVPRAAERDLAVACYSRGAMPPVLDGAGERLRVLAQVGDAVLKSSVVTAMVKRDSAQTAKGVSDEVCVRLSNARLARRGFAMELEKAYSYSEPCVSDTMMATMVEAVIGAVYLHTSVENAEKLMRWLEVSS